MSGLLQFDAGPAPASLSGGELRVREPATGLPLAVVPLAAEADVHVAVAAARLTQPGWAAAPPVGRATVLRRAAAALERHREEVANWLVREGGAIRGKAEHEVGAALDELWEAAALPTRPHGSLLAAEPGQESVGRRVPLGVVGVISPWNVPLLLAMRAVAPALALGNAVVLKPDVHTPVSGGHVIARLFEEAGLPDGVLHVLPGDAGPGQALVEHPDVSMIDFTGSTAVGRRIGAAMRRRAQARIARTGRQQRPDRARRRRPGGRRLGRRIELVLPPGPDLHGGRTPPDSPLGGRAATSTCSRRRPGSCASVTPSAKRSTSARSSTSGSSTGSTASSATPPRRAPRW